MLNQCTLWERFFVKPFVEHKYICQVYNYVKNKKIVTAKSPKRLTLTGKTKEISWRK